VTATVWVVGQVMATTDKGIVWDIQGVFDTQEAAVAACRDATYFIGPVPMNQQLPHERVAVWEGCYYPLCEVG
jgi:hypothetical protein